MELLSKRIAATSSLKVIHQFPYFVLLHEKSRRRAAFLGMERRLF
jgi:hypothetical protein